jgi:hypothetical protein
MNLKTANYIELNIGLEKGIPNPANPTDVALALSDTIRAVRQKFQPGGWTTEALVVQQATSIANGQLVVEHTLAIRLVGICSNSGNDRTELCWEHLGWRVFHETPGKRQGQVLERIVHWAVHDLACKLGQNAITYKYWSTLRADEVRGIAGVDIKSYGGEFNDKFWLKPIPSNS